LTPTHGLAQARAQAVATAAPGSPTAAAVAALVPGIREAAWEAGNTEVAAVAAPLGAKEVAEKVDGTRLQVASLEAQVRTHGTNKAPMAVESLEAVVPAEDRGPRDSSEGAVVAVALGLKADSAEERSSPDRGTPEASEVLGKVEAAVPGRGLKVVVLVAGKAMGELDLGLGQEEEAAEVNLDQGTEVDLEVVDPSHGLAPVVNCREAPLRGQGKVKGVMAEDWVRGKVVKHPVVEHRGTKVDTAAPPSLSPTLESFLALHGHGIKDHTVQESRAEVVLDLGTVGASEVGRAAAAVPRPGPAVAANPQEDLDHGLKVATEVDHPDLVRGIKAAVTEGRKEVAEQVRGTRLQIMVAELAPGAEPAAAEAVEVTEPARVLVALPLGLRAENMAEEAADSPPGPKLSGMDREAAGTTASKRDGVDLTVAVKDQELAKFSGALAETTPGRNHRRGLGRGRLTGAKSTSPQGLVK
ncbi:unnamed protein product, partial [Ixodes hexagonus]